MPSWRHWAADEYESWCVERASELLRRGAQVHWDVPTTKAEAWLAVLSIFDAWRQGVEDGRGWQTLWSSDDTHRDEEAVQVAFFQVARALAGAQGISVQREVETGRGPVDFLFQNGVRVRVLLEFKLIDSSNLLHGLNSQLPEYMRGLGADSAFYVCVAFEDGAEARFQRVEQTLADLRQRAPHLFIQAQLVDARRRRGASARTNRPL
jgi:hypothetical protein